MQLLIDFVELDGLVGHALRGGLVDKLYQIDALFLKACQACCDFAHDLRNF